MPKFAVLMRYEVITGLVIDAESEDQAEQLATEFEERVHDTAESADTVKHSARIWGGGTIDIKAAADEDDAEDLLDEWIEEIDDSDLLDDEEYDEDDFDEDDEDEDDFEDEDVSDTRR